MSRSALATGLPIIDMSLLHNVPSAVDAIAEQLDRACQEFGFFYLVGHGIDPTQVDYLQSLSREFFALDAQAKCAIHMSKGGRAWRGYFQLGEELTSGRPDRKEGIYFGSELGEDDARVQARWPLHGANLFPPIEGFKAAVLNYIVAITGLGQAVLRLLATALHLEEGFFAEHYTSDPTVLFRIFNYPCSGSSNYLCSVPANADGEGYGVGAHTDYGLLTLLKQDHVGGLQVRNRDRWLAVPDVADSFVCNVGDMLERLTKGRYLSALHRVRSSSTHDRLSMALFLDPSFDAVLTPIDSVQPVQNSAHTQVRWDHLDPHAVHSTYGEYLLSKVGKVFPQLRERALK